MKTTDPNAQARNKGRDYLFLTGCALFLYLHLFILPAAPIFYEKDTMVFAHNAIRMLEGEVIFKDFFQYIFPGSELVYLFFFKIFGLHFWVLNGVLFLLYLSTAWFTFTIARHFLRGAYAYLPSLIYLMFGARWLGLEGSHRWFCVLFVLMALTLLLKSRTDKSLALAGILLGVAVCFTQTTGLAALVGIALFVIWTRRKEQQSWREIFFGEIYLVGAFALVLIAGIFYFSLRAGFHNYWDLTVTFLLTNAPGEVWNKPSAYLSEVPASLSFRNLREGAVVLFYYLLIPLVYIIFFIVYWVRSRRGRETENSENLLLLVGLVGVCLFLSLQIPTVGRLYSVSPPGLILMAWLLVISGRIGRLIANAALVFIICLGAFQCLRMQTQYHAYLDAPAGRIAFLSSEVPERIQWLMERTKPGDYFFESYHPDVYFPLLLRNATSMYFLRPTGFTRPEQISEVIEGLERNKPRYILWDGNWTKEQSARESDDPLQPLADYLQGHYAKVKEFTPYGDETKLGESEKQDGEKKQIVREVWERKQ